MKSAQLAAQIPDGASIALAPDYSGCALAVIRALIARGARNLHLIGCPQLGLQAELLIAGGCVTSIETAAIGLGEAGQAPAFARSYREGRIVVQESTCPAIHSGLQATEKGVPFLPVAGVIGSDLIGARPDWRVIDDPFQAEPILVVPAIKPDFALFHCPLGDVEGSVWIGVRRELMLMAHAARSTITTVERIQQHPLVKDVALGAGTIPGVYISEVSHFPKGAWPCGLFGEYEADQEWLTDYLEAANDGDRCHDFVMRWAVQ